MYVNGANSGYAPYGSAPTQGPAPTYAPQAYGQDAYAGSFTQNYPQQPPQQQGGGLFGGLFNAIGSLLMGAIGLVRNVCKLAVGLVMSIVGPILQPIMGLFVDKKAQQQQQAAMQQQQQAAMEAQRRQSPQAQELNRQIEADLTKWEKWAKDNQAKIQADPKGIGEPGLKQAQAEWSIQEKQLASFFGPNAPEVRAFRERSEAITQLLKGEGKPQSGNQASLEFVQNLQQLDEVLDQYDAKVPADKRHATFAELKQLWDGMKQQQATFAASNPELAGDVAAVMQEVATKMAALEAKLATEPQPSALEVELPPTLR